MQGLCEKYFIDGLEKDIAEFVDISWYRPYDCVHTLIEVVDQLLRVVALDQYHQGWQDYREELHAV